MKRLAVRIAFLGALGFVLTIAQCWWLALQVDRISSPRLNPSGGVGMSGYVSESDQTLWILHPERSASGMWITSFNSGPIADDGLTVQWYIEKTEIPAWCVIRRGDPNGAADAFYNEQAFGWPMLAMAQCERSELQVQTGTIVRDTDGLRLPSGLQRLVPGRSVPIHILWLGAIVDSIVAGWMCFAVYRFPGVVIRAYRRRKHRCTSCGYDLRGAEHHRCPECGESIQRRSIKPSHAKRPSSSA